MKNVSISIIYNGIKTINTQSNEKNIGQLLKRVFNNEIDINNESIKIYNEIKLKKNIRFIILDRNYKLLTPNSKVRNKILLVAIDINKLSIIEEKLKYKEQLSIIKDYIYSIEEIIVYNIKEQSKEEIKITKEIFNEIIKPVIVKKKELKKKPEEKPQEKHSKEENKTEVKKQKKEKKLKVKAKKIIIQNKNILLKPIVIKKKKTKVKKVEKVEVSKPVKEEPKIVKKETKKKSDYSSKIHVIVYLNEESNKVVTLFEKKESKKKPEVKKEEEKKPKKQEKTKDKPQKVQIEDIPKVVNEVVVSDNSSDKSTDNLNKKQEEQKDKSEKADKPIAQTITYTVVSPNKEVLYNKQLNFEKPISVQDLLLQSGLIVNNTNGFIESINGISNKDMSGWVFEVNDVPVMVSASEYIINPNDQITWKYVDFSKKEKEESNSKVNKTKKVLTKTPVKPNK